MKLKFLILFFLGFIGTITAQNSGSITGKVIDQKTNEPLPYVTIVVKNNDATVTGGITDEKGEFEISKLASQNYTVEIQFIGYKTVAKEVNLTNSKKVELGTISISEDVQQLEGVEVVAEQSQMVQKIDRKVINVGKDLIASGTTASDIMNNVPTLSIDPQTKEISMRGNSNVRVLIDGKPSNIPVEQLLQQIPSASIKQIELITNPSAKYNPEGMSGIINIILHKNSQDGFNGSINTGVTFGITPKTNTNINLNYRVGKVNFYTNYGYNHGINANHGSITSERPSLENTQDFSFRTLNNSHLIKLGMDYYINEKNNISFYTNQNITDSNGDGKTIVNYIDDVTNRNSSQIFYNGNESHNQTYDLAYHHDFNKKDETLDVQFNYSKTKDTENTKYNDTTFNPTENSVRINKIEGDTDYFQFNTDYVNPLTETSKLELGVETRLQKTSSDFQNIDNSGTSLSNFNFDRNIYSAYFNLGKQIGKWSGQIGARFEYFDLNANFNPTSQNVSDDLFTVYPSAFITYTKNEKNSFNFNYSRRVDRPSIGQLNPIREWTTPLLESRGNPDLVPQFTNSFEINYTRKTKIGSITSGVFYRLINDEISRVVFNDPNDINRNILSYDNFNNNDAIGVESSANLKFTKWWSVNASVDAYFRTVKGTVQNAETENFENKQVDVVMFNARMNNSFTATQNLRFQLFGFYRGKDISLQYDRKPMYKMDVGASYNFAKGKGTITARFNDVFDNMRFAFDGGIPYRQYGAFYWENQTVYLGLNYRFGGGKNRALSRKQRDLNETQSSGGMF
ncbi:TonB-dependent receptor domain-containing protein [Flavobacterium haoranii]|uniref:Outer membrane receptor for ferrienterochelin and colicins n=1 Tax=Flavobacterium haoranii TaxID=683124 RepID=A0A1M6BPT2_9FLAO|nr:TonB-dependent receptor [Flavobacterium haoranii]SHI50702.1 Outer membrane receptor for ferrienterochelin and colicins [Flavobacterium haoranii]